MKQRKKRKGASSGRGKDPLRYVKAQIWLMQQIIRVLKPVILAMMFVTSLYVTYVSLLRGDFLGISFGLAMLVGAIAWAIIYIKRPEYR